MKLTLSKLWKLSINVAIGINIGLMLTGLITGNYTLIPLAVINCALLATAFLPTNLKDPE